VDNQGAIALAKNPVLHQRTKHIDIRYFFIREKIDNNMFDMLYVETMRNLADLFTKPVVLDQTLPVKSTKKVFQWSKDEKSSQNVWCKFNRVS